MIWSDTKELCAAVARSFDLKTRLQEKEQLLKSWVLEPLPPYEGTAYTLYVWGLESRPQEKDEFLAQTLLPSTYPRVCPFIRQNNFQKEPNTEAYRLADSSPGQASTLHDNLIVPHSLMTSLWIQAQRRNLLSDLISPDSVGHLAKVDPPWAHLPTPTPSSRRLSWGPSTPRPPMYPSSWLSWLKRRSHKK